MHHALMSGDQKEDRRATKEKLAASSSLPIVTARKPRRGTPSEVTVLGKTYVVHCGIDRRKFGLK
jgi:hypothetical protein